MNKLLTWMFFPIFQILFSSRWHIHPGAMLDDSVHCMVDALPCFVAHQFHLQKEQHRFVRDGGSTNKAVLGIYSVYSVCIK